MESTASQTDKPHVLCFHCQNAIYPEVLATRREFRTQYGIDVFKCPSCEKDFKIDPREFLELREQVSKGLWPIGKSPALIGLSQNEFTPYEMIEAQFVTHKNQPFSQNLNVGAAKPMDGKWVKVGIVLLLTVMAVLWFSK